MLAAAGLALVCGRARSVRDVLGTAAAVVCVLDPWAPMAAGFWLSFAAVAAIVWHGARVRPAPAARGGAVPAGWTSRLRAMLAEAGRSQVAATRSLLPLGALFCSSVSLVGPLANAVAIPLVSGLVTPLALAGALFALLPGPVGGYL
ncbi:MAG: ComEC/Rec2 family competence protein, partial [bacterium]